MRSVKRSELKRQLQNSTNSELEVVMKEEHKNLYMLRQQAALKQLNNPLAIRESRKKLARILTILREREIKEQAKA